MQTLKLVEVYQCPNSRCHSKRFFQHYKRSIVVDNHGNYISGDKYNSLWLDDDPYIIVCAQCGQELE